MSSSTISIICPFAARVHFARNPPDAPTLSAAGLLHCLLTKTCTGPVFRWKKRHACEFRAVYDTFDDLKR